MSWNENMITIFRPRGLIPLAQRKIERERERERGGRGRGRDKEIKDGINCRVVVPDKYGSPYRHRSQAPFREKIRAPRRRWARIRHRFQCLTLRALVKLFQSKFYKFNCILYDTAAPIPARQPACIGVSGEVKITWSFLTENSRVHGAARD